MSSSDSDSSDSSDCSTGWPWQCGRNRQSAYDDSDCSFSEDLSDESSFEKGNNDSWINRRNIFISVYNINNHINTTLVTNYNELHNYRDNYKKLSKKTADNIKNIWNNIKVNVPELGIVPLKSYEKKLIEDSKKKQKESNKSVVKLSVKTQNQSSKETPKTARSNEKTQKVDSKTENRISNLTNVTSKNKKENCSNGVTKNNENNSNIKVNDKGNESNQKQITGTPTKVAKSNQENKSTPKSSSTKNDKKDKGAKMSLVFNGTKSESDKKIIKIVSTNSTTKLDPMDKNTKNKSNASNLSESEFKKPNAKSKLDKNTTDKNNATEIISKTKLKKRKQKNSHSQSSENSDIKNRSNSEDSRTKTPVKKKAKQKIEEPEDSTDDEDEDKNIIDNMDALTGNSAVINPESFELVKYKNKQKVAEDIKVVNKKVHCKNNNEQNIEAQPVLDNHSVTTSEKNYVFYSEKFAEESVDMMLQDNLIGGLEYLVEAMQFNPGDDRHYLNRCYCYLRLGRPALALADAQYLLQTSSHYGHRFIAYLRAGQASIALQNYFKDALSINSDNLYAQREMMRAKISRIVSLGYTERNAILALQKYSKTQDAINYLANKTVMNNGQNLDNYNTFFDVGDNLDDVVYSSDDDDKPNNTTLINNILNYEPIVTKLFHLLAKPANLTTNTLVSLNKNTNSDIKKKNTINNKANIGLVMEKSIWVGSLTKNITEAMLKKKFRQFGNVISVYCPPNEAYAFVNFEKSEHVANVLKNSYDCEINGAKLVVRPAVQKK